MGKTQTTLFILLITSLSACDFEDKYVLHPCAGNFNKEKFIDSVNKTCSLAHSLISFEEDYIKEYILDKELSKNCDTIHCFFTADNAAIFEKDTFVRSVARIFFSDTSNHSVKVLNIEFTAYMPAVGKEIIIYNINRDEAFKPTSEESNNPDSSSIEYKIKEEQSYFYSVGSDDSGKGISVDVTVENDLKLPITFTETIKHKYAEKVRQDNIKQLDINIAIRNPGNRLCISKVYNFFFCQRNKNLF